MLPSLPCRSQASDFGALRATTHMVRSATKASATLLHWPRLSPLYLSATSGKGSGLLSPGQGNSSTGFPASQSFSKPSAALSCLVALRGSLATSL